MTLSQSQIDDEKLRFKKWFWIWERDLLQLAREHQLWRYKALELGFSEETIAKLWPHFDAGRHIKYALNPYYQEDERHDRTGDDGAGALKRATCAHSHPRRRAMIKPLSTDKPSVSDYVRWKHSCVSHDSWGKVYWACRCGESGFVNTETQAQNAIFSHQKSEAQQVSAAPATDNLKLHQEAYQRRVRLLREQENDSIDAPAASLAPEPCPPWESWKHNDWELAGEKAYAALRSKEN